MAAEEKYHLLEFFGQECVHCHKMDHLVERLEEDLGVTVNRLEVWHNQANAALLRQLDQGRCGGVPFFYNTHTGRWICGEATYEALKEWTRD